MRDRLVTKLELECPYESERAFLRPLLLINVAY